eukprot:CAMPEP_0173424858 /NCGR_PEP_ID=MMETSP1357-20121228/4708_1 /TAXON_ID=77926 /ORGANISM="Hemiselmis rufescens, Strain PCC563" /LENGTH=97 /DNA_ID=CAMNT_0014388187 /DNA_START=102 /DNA_END=393 /DNA_ORIENTATION=+
MISILNAINNRNTGKDITAALVWNPRRAFPSALGACFTGLLAAFFATVPALPPFFFDAASSLASILCSSSVAAFLAFALAFFGVAAFLAAALGAAFF